jgi:hypothetical protein
MRDGDGIPTLLANVIGGVTLVAFLNHAWWWLAKQNWSTPGVNRR